MSTHLIIINIKYRIEQTQPSSQSNEKKKVILKPFKCSINNEWMNKFALNKGTLLLSLIMAMIMASSLHPRYFCLHLLKRHYSKWILKSRSKSKFKSEHCKGRDVAEVDSGVNFFIDGHFSWRIWDFYLKNSD